jgi:hypothetical protein
MHIRAAQYISPMSSWTPDVTKEGLQPMYDSLVSKLNALEPLVDSKKHFVQDFRQSYETQTQAKLQQAQHQNVYHRLETWLRERIDTPSGDTTALSSISAANQAISQVELRVGETQTMVGAGLTTLEQIGTQLSNAKFASKHASWSFTDQQSLHTRVANLQRLQQEFMQKLEHEKQSLDKVLAIEVRKEEYRMEFAHIVAEYQRFHRDTLALIAPRRYSENQCEPTASFGVSVETVRALAEEQQAEVAGIVQTSLAKQVTFMRCFNLHDC